MTPREFGLSIGYQQGQTIEGAELRAFERQYEEYRKQAVAGWETYNRPDPDGNIIRVNPHTGQGMVITNMQGQPMKAGGNDPFAGYMNPGGVAGAAAVDPSSAAFAGVQPAAAPQANPVAPVNVNPAMPSAAPAPAPTPAPQAAAPAFRSEDEVIAAARAKLISKEQAQAILVNQFGLDP